MAQTSESIHEIPLLTAEECDRVRRELHAVRGRWRKRNQFPFYTVGAASYLDHTAGRETMLQRAAEDNPLLTEHFHWVHERVIKALADYVDQPALLDPVFAAPGFHVFEGHEAFTQPLASMHFDLQYEHYDWSERYREVDRSSPLSLTLPIKLPACGSGLRVWDITWEKAQEMSKEDFTQFKKTAPFTYHPYAPGVMVIHSGHYLHQIAPLTEVQPGDERITMQAHSARTEQGWVVYW